MVGLYVCFNFHMFTLFTWPEIFSSLMWSCTILIFSSEHITEISFSIRLILSSILLFTSRFPEESHHGSAETRQVTFYSGSVSFQFRSKVLKVPLLLQQNFLLRLLRKHTLTFLILVKLTPDFSVFGTGRKNLKKTFSYP